MHTRFQSLARGRVLLKLVACVALAVPLLADPPSETYQGRRVGLRQVIVKLRNPLDAKALGLLGQSGDALRIRALGAGRFHLIESRSQNVARLIAVLSKLPGVDLVEANDVIHATETNPNDPQFGNLWGLKNPALPGADISATRAWDITTGSTANVVAVVDSGIDYTHPDLAANVWSAPHSFTVTIGGNPVTCPAGSHGYNALTGACDPLDDYGHGSHVSGTIGAVGNNSAGVVGVNWRTKMMGIKFLDSTGSGTVSDAINAIDFAIQVKAAFANTATPVNVRVMSASWGGSGFSQSLLDAINSAGAQDILFVAAAGNAGQNIDSAPTYPAAYTAANLVVVAATTSSDGLASFSNFSATKVHLGAPGVSILSTVNGGGYAYSSGTSMATPHVSGTAALVLSSCSLSTAALRSTLLNSVDPVPALAGVTASGGRLNAYKALQTCTGTTPTFTPIRVNAGGPAYTDSFGNAWSADTGYANGYTYGVSAPVTGTSDPALYQSERYGPGTLQYQFSVPNGSYNVKLRFAEIYFGTPGSRVFNLVLNGTTVQTNFDPVAAAGGAFKAVDRSYTVNVTGGQMVLQFVTVIDNATVSGIEITASSTSTPIAVAVSPLTATLTASQSQQFTASVSGASNTAVAWSMSPSLGTLSSAGLYTAPATITAAQTVVIRATSAADGTTSATATVTLQPPTSSSGFTPIRVNAGGPAYTDSLGNAWSADTGYFSGSVYTVSAPVSSTSDTKLYQSERYGTFQYQFSVPNGSYNVKLRFAEIYFSTPGSRVFNLVLNGTTVQTNFDPVAAAGGAFKAVDRSYTVNVTGGQMVLQFVTVIDNATVSGIEITASSTSTPIAVAVSPLTATLTASQSQQFTASVSGTSNTAVAWSMSPSLGTLSSAGLYTAPATITAAQTVVIQATSAADGTTSATATVTLQPSGSGFTPIRVNAGGPAYTDSLGNAWSADTGYFSGSVYTVSAPVSGTSDTKLYQSERYGTFQYQFSVPNGSYNVKLRFAEIYFSTPGSRVFNLVLNGTTVQSNFDPVAAAGGAFKAVDRSYTVNVTGGQMVLGFVTVIDNATVSGIEITGN